MTTTAVEPTPRCPLCSADLAPVIGQSRHWRTVVNRNQDLLGKAMIVLLRHEERVAALTADEWADLRDRMRCATEGLTAAFTPDHFNYAFLQNADRHVHLHVIPRYRAARSFDGLVFEDPGWPEHYAVGRESRVPHDVLEAVGRAIASAT